MLKNNVGTLDRAARIVVGGAVVSLAFFGPQTAWGYLGMIPLLTGLIGSCPAYQLFGINTCSLKKQPH